VTGDELTLRAELSNLRGLLALSMLMTERRQEEDIIHLVTTAVPALVHVRPQGVHLAGVGWRAAAGACADAEVRADVDGQLAAAPVDGGPLTIPGAPWAWAFGLRSLDVRIGHLIVTGDRTPSSSELLLLRSLAQQTGIALANARLHATRQATNAALAEIVAALRRKTAIHDRFTQVAINGGGYDGIVRALHELTGFPAGVEDRTGALLAWAGPDDQRPRPPASRARRDQLVERALRAGHPVRADGRLLTVARPRADVVGVLLLVDPDGRAGEQETVALEHGATVLAIELARMLSVAETELRLGRDLVADLVNGTVDGVRHRAQALGHDLDRPHRVLVVSHRARENPDELLHAVRELAGAGRPALTMHQGDSVVLLTPVPTGSGPTPWERLSAGLRATPAGRGCRIGVGGPCHSPADFARSYRQAQLALRLAQFSGGRAGLVVHDDLGVYQLLSEAADPSAVESFVQTWLGPLLEYDARRGATLVQTLARHLDCGGNYDLTAQALGLGRSTVRYRLGRIRQLSGHDLADPDTRFQLQLATRAWVSLQALSAG
jgi:sugar diacid utilization regulator